MIEAISLDLLLDELKRKYPEGKRSIGILFARPSSRLVKEEIINDLDYFHHRSSKTVDFYFPGYGAYWNDTYPDKKEVCKIASTTWYFSDEKFTVFVCAIEQMSTWEYNGETELLIIDFNNGNLDFSNVTTLWIEKAIEDKATRSARNMFEAVFRAFRNTSGTFLASDQLVYSFGKKHSWDMVLDRLPYGLGKVYNKTQYFCTRNLNKSV